MKSLDRREIGRLAMRSRWGEREPTVLVRVFKSDAEKIATLGGCATTADNVRRILVRLESKSRFRSLAKLANS